MKIALKSCATAKCQGFIYLFIYYTVYTHVKSFRGGKDLCQLGKRYFNALMCKFANCHFVVDEILVNLLTYDTPIYH